MATHTCEAGYALTTDLSTRTCGVTGFWWWSESDLVCAGMGSPNTYSTNHSHYLTGSVCPDLTDLQNGVISYSTVSDNSYRRVTTVATYTCNTGFELIGTSTRTCSVSGWEGTAPTCTGIKDCYMYNYSILLLLAVDCGPLSAPSNGAVDTSSGTTFMMTATYTCNTGYTLTGDTTRMCGAGGSWTLMEPTCVGMYIIIWLQWSPQLLTVVPWEPPHGIIGFKNGCTYYHIM